MERVVITVEKYDRLNKAFEESKAKTKTILMYRTPYDTAIVCETNDHATEKLATELKGVYVEFHNIREKLKELPKGKTIEDVKKMNWR